MIKCMMKEKCLSLTVTALLAITFPNICFVEPDRVGMHLIDPVIEIII